MTHTTARILVTIVAEPVLEEQLVRVLKDLGATGYTITEGRGEGSRALHATALPGEKIRVEVIVRPDVADRMLQRLADQYFENYSMSAWLTEVAVFRGDKY
jgi:nitrogen regulatory protein P-II 2